MVREIGWAPPSSSVERVGGVENDTKQRKSGEHGNASEIKYSTSKYRRRPGWSQNIAGVDMECELIWNIDGGVMSNGADKNSRAKE